MVRQGRASMPDGEVDRAGVLDGEAPQGKHARWLGGQGRRA